MSNKISWVFSALVVLLFSCISTVSANEESVAIPGIQQNNPQDSPSYADNEYCLRCHSSGYFVLSDSATGRSKRQAMCVNFNIPKEKYYNSVHWTFSCLDCHSSEYKTFPHATALRFEPKLVCIDCHGGDENFAKYHFEEIEADYGKSIHAKIDNGEFSCWKCHNPHSYVPLARRDSLTTNFVVASNQMCLSCHGNFEKFQLLSDRELTGVIDKHDWLPNHELHFKSVRCIECHSAQNSNILISHNILPKDSAISDCVKCHSGNSILMGTLYKFRTIENRKAYGFVNAAIIDNNSYVIGANHSKFMNISGLLIIFMTLVAVIIHTIFRIKKSKNKVNV
jgi:hypothetical protein